MTKDQLIEITAEENKQLKALAKNGASPMEIAIATIGHNMQTQTRILFDIAEALRGKK